VGGALPSGTVSFAAGETSKTITLNVSGDTVVESDEGFTVTLSGPTSGSVIGTASADGLIQNDDFAAIETAGATRLDRVANQFFLHDSGGNGPSLKFQGTAFAVGQFGAWTPIGAEKAGSGYQVAWKNGAADQYLVWTVDGSGNWLSQSAVMSGASTALQVLEPGFSQDLNGVGGITARTVIESSGSTALARIANTFVVSPTTSAFGLQLMMNGAAVTVGQFGNWTPIGAEQAANGTYQVAWKNGALDQYIGWIFDSSGNYLSQGAVVAGGSWYVEAYESALHQDLNGDSTTGPTTTTIERAGSTTLTQVADSYFFNYASGGPQLKMNGAYVTPGQFGTWTPIAAEQTGSGYQVAWKHGAANQYLVWSTDGSGNWLSQTGAMSGSSSAFKAYESTFKQDLNLNGVIDVVSSMISSSDSTAQIASASSATVNVALLTSYMASAFAMPDGESTGGPTVAETFHEQQLAKPAI
jgi:hypothetical protein